MQKTKMPTISQNSWVSGRICAYEAAEYACKVSMLWDVEINQIKAPRSAFTCRYLTDNHAVVYEEVYGAAATARGALRGKTICFAISNEIGRGGCWKGRSLPGHALAYSHGGRDADTVWAHGTANIMAIVPYEVMAERLWHLSGREVGELFPSAGMFVTLSPAAMSRLLDFFRRLLLGKMQPAETMLHTLVADAVIEATSGCHDSGTSGSPAAWYHFRRVVDRIKQGSLPSRLPSLAAEMGVTLRTMESAFRQCAGMSPGAYLRYERLNRVRDALLAHGPSDTTVTALALHQGFSELGRFAGEYRHVFGESPSETLRRCERRDRGSLPGLG
jgi:AraC-like DNA-binding protein